MKEKIKEKIIKHWWIPVLLILEIILGKLITGRWFGVLGATP